MCIRDSLYIDVDRAMYSRIFHEIYSCICRLQSYRPYDLLLHFPVLRNLRFSQYNLGLVFHTIYSCIFHSCYLLLLFPLLHFLPLQFCSYRIFHSRIFSPPVRLCRDVYCRLTLGGVYDGADSGVKSVDRLLELFFEQHYFHTTFTTAPCNIPSVIHFIVPFHIHIRHTRQRQSHSNIVDYSRLSIDKAPTKVC